MPNQCVFWATSAIVKLSGPIGQICLFAFAKNLDPKINKMLQNYVVAVNPCIKIDL